MIRRPGVASTTAAGLLADDLQVALRLGIIGAKANGRGEGTLGVIPTAEAEEGEAEVVLDVGRLRGESGGLLEVLGGAGEVIEADEHEAEVVAGLGVLGSQADRLGERVGGLAVAAELSEGQTKLTLCFGQGAGGRDVRGDGGGVGRGVLAEPDDLGEGVGRLGVAALDAPARPRMS